jgi:hypothetical protein
VVVWTGSKVAEPAKSLNLMLIFGFYFCVWRRGVVPETQQNEDKLAAKAAP